MLSSDYDENSDQDDDEIKSYIEKKLIIAFDDEKENISFSSVKLDNFYFKPLQENIDTLIFCAFFANHFDFFYSYSYFLSINITNVYDENSIGNREHFSFKNQSFRSFVPILYYRNECLLDINNFIELSPSGSSKESIRCKLVENKNETNDLLLNELIDLVEYMGAFFYHEFIFIESDDQIISTIEKDYHTDFIARTYIFKSKTDVPYQVPVEFSVENISELKTKFIFRIYWCILKDTLIYIDDDENLYEFNMKTYSFCNKGKNKNTRFQNLIYVCYSLQCQ